MDLPSPEQVARLPLNEQRRVLKLVKELAEAEAVEKARGRFIDYVRYIWPPFISGRHHAIMADAFDRIINGTLKRLIIAMPPRHCLTLDTPILTTEGWKTMAAVLVGDQVFGPDGKPTSVIGKSPVYENRHLWRVSDQYGESVICDDGHLWEVALCRKRSTVFHRKTAQQLAERQATISEGRKPWIPEHLPVDLPDADLPIDPYLFGVWLGDGHNGQAIITMRDEDAEYVRPRIESAGYTTTDQTTRYTFGVLDLKVKLRALGVLGNKHIPDRYLHASPAQLTALLHGLMDTDGNVTKSRQCFLATSSPVLRDQYREVLWRLGIKNGCATSRAIFNGRDYGETYRISFYHDDVSTLPRKQGRAAGHIKPVRRYLTFEDAGFGAVQCIEVDRPDGLFLAGSGLLVTHNTKSEFGSWLLPSKYLGHYPDKKIIMASHSAELAQGFGRKVRNLVDSEPYQKVFPETVLTPDSKAAGRWSTSRMGEYFAIGVGGNIAGRGADLFVIDDAHSEQDYLSALAGDVATFDKAYEWYTSGPRQRLQPGGAIVVIGTRWHVRDIPGRLIRAMTEPGGKREQWELIEFPAILNDDPLWPEYWPIEELEAVRETIPVAQWNAQYLQNPILEEGALIKREWWRIWEDDKPPQCDYIIDCWDTAFRRTQRSDYSARTSWGVFYRPDESGKTKANIILLDAERGRWEFPALKRRAYERWKEVKPDSLIIEGKASGDPLAQELRAMGVMVTVVTPTRGSRADPNDKIHRVNAVTDMFASGVVWCPETRWADEVREECAAFPAGDHDDYVDTVVMAMNRFRNGGFIRLDTDMEYEPRRRRRAAYY